MNEFNFPEVDHRKTLWICIHICALVCIIAYQSVFIIYIGYSVTIRGAAIFLLQALVYFLNVFWVIPVIFRPRTKLSFVLRLIFIVFFYEIARALIIGGISLAPLGDLLFSGVQHGYTSLQLLLVLGTSLLTGLYRQNEKNSREREAALKAYIEAVSERQRMETIAYQMQLNPHITFNTLNSIRTQSAEVQPNVAKAAQLLSNLLRRSLNDPVYNQKLPLLSEVDDLKDHIAIYRHLAGGRIHLDFQTKYDEEVDDLKLPPSLLVTIADNVFKYGHLNEKQYLATITLSVLNSRLEFSTYNFKRMGLSPGGGIGLKNVKIILDHYYPEKHRLTIEDLEESFSLKLTIDL
jgi:two-component system LytT family sensor kinase